MALQQSSAVGKVEYRACGEIRLYRRLQPTKAAAERCAAKPKSSFRNAAKRAAEAAKRSALVYSAELQDCEKVGFGKLASARRFTPYAKFAVRDGCAILKERFKTNVVFATGTIAGSTYEALQTVAKYSGLIVQRVEQWIRDTAPGSLQVLIWEWQKRGALHIHVAIGNNDKRLLRRLRIAFKTYWFNLLGRIGERAGVDLFARRDGGTWLTRKNKCRANCVPVRKDIGRYMAKYLSKGGHTNVRALAFPTFPVPCPSRWWGMSRSLVQESKQQKHRCWFPTEQFDMVAQFLANACDAVFSYQQHIARGDVVVAYPRDGDCADVWQMVITLLANFEG